MDKYVSVVNEWVGLATKDEYNTLFTVIIIVWGVIDTITTYVGIALYNGVENEVNPLVKEMILTHPLWFLVVKMITMLWVFLVATQGKHHIQDVKLWKAYLSCVVLFGFCVIAVNMFTITVGVMLYL